MGAMDMMGGGEFLPGDLLEVPPMRLMKRGGTSVLYGQKPRV